MATRDKAPMGQPCWTDLMVDDVNTARTFYPAVLGWEAGEQAEEFGGYFQFFRDGRPVAGGSPKIGDAAVPDAWNVYVAVEDTTPFVEKARAAGATIYAPTMRVGDLGTMAMIGDPSGAAIGAWTPITFEGFGLIDEPGAPRWFELHSRDFAAAVPFYEEVFAWTTRSISDTEEFRYSVAEEGEHQFLGLADASAWLPEGVPSYWTVYFGVADVDATVAAALEHGGSVVTPAEDTPYGRIAALAAPGGAIFRVITA
ncbi:MAG: VOC family protein [Acidimicrobiales bacterium]